MDRDQVLRVVLIIFSPLIVVLSCFGLIVIAVIDIVESLKERKNHTKEVKQS